MSDEYVFKGTDFGFRPYEHETVTGLENKIKYALDALATKVDELEGRNQVTRVEVEKVQKEETT